MRFDTSTRVSCNRFIGDSDKIIGLLDEIWFPTKSNLLFIKVKCVDKIVHSSVFCTMFVVMLYKIESV